MSYKLSSEQKVRKYEKEKERRLKNIEQYKKVSRSYYWNHKEAIITQRKERRLKHNAYMNQWSRTYYVKRRMMVIDYYSKGKRKCNCCGEKEYKFLCIDHIKGGGSKHRKELKTGGRHYVDWLIRNNYPKGIQILCHNCNLAKGFYGKCPHKLKIKK